MNKTNKLFNLSQNGMLGIRKTVASENVCSIQRLLLFQYTTTYIRTCMHTLRLLNINELILKIKTVTCRWDGILYLA